MIKIIKISICIISLLLAILFGARFSDTINSIAGQDIKENVDIEIPEKEVDSVVPNMEDESISMEDENSEKILPKKITESIKLDNGMNMDITIEEDISLTEEEVIPSAEEENILEEPVLEMPEQEEKEILLKIDENEFIEEDIIDTKELQEISEDEIMQEPVVPTPSSDSMNNGM